jgi:FkbM family methyltransferase
MQAFPAALRAPRPPLREVCATAKITTQNKGLACRMEKTDATANLALGRPATQSSVSAWSIHADREQDARIANSGTVDPGRSCHTDAEAQPWWQVELDGIHDIGRVVIHNRPGFEAQLRHFTLLRSINGTAWFEFFRKADDSDFAACTIRVDTPQLARFLRLRRDDTGFLHFTGCEVYGLPIDPETARELQAAADAEPPGRALPPPGRSGQVALLGGFAVFVDEQYSFGVRHALLSGAYEGRERNAVSRLLRPTDRVLEVGTAIGAVAMTAAAIVGPSRVATFDANPRMVEAARDNFARNGFGAIRVDLGIMANRSRFVSGRTVPFHIARDFLASRLDASPGAPDIVETVDVPLHCLEDHLARDGTNVIISDIEGGEVALFEGAMLDNVRLIIMETHYGFAGEAPTDRMIAYLIAQGFSINLRETMAEVVVLRR